MSSLLVEVLRVIFLSGAGLAIAMTGLVLVRYQRAHKHIRVIEEVTGRRRWRGLLPRHVWAISLSHLLLLLVVVYGVIERAQVASLLGTVAPATAIRIVVLVVALALTLFALSDVLRFQRARGQHVLSEDANPVAAPETHPATPTDPPPPPGRHAAP